MKKAVIYPKRSLRRSVLKYLVTTSSYEMVFAVNLTTKNIMDMMVAGNDPNTVTFF